MPASSDAVSHAEHEPQALYFIRHPESEADFLGLACGRGWDPPLTRDGMNQLRRLWRSRIPLEKLGIRSIVTSSLLRAVQAAALLHDRIPAPLIALPSLDDRHLGSWERRKLRELGAQGLGGAEIPGAEGVAAFQERVRAGIAAALARPAPVLLVGHLSTGELLLEQLGLGRLTLEGGVLQCFERSGEAPWALTAKLGVGGSR